MNDRGRGRDSGEDSEIEPLSDYLKAYIDQQVQIAIKGQEEALPKKKKWRNSWRSASPITKASFLISFAALAASIAYTVTAWRTLVTMRQISGDNSQQTSQLIDAATQMKTAAWQFKGSAQGIDGNLGNAVARLNDQADATRQVAQAATSQATTANTIAIATKQSADTAAMQVEIGERPWVQANISIAGPFAFENGEARISLNFQLENSGNSPAFETFINMRSTYLDFSGSYDVLVKKRDDLCKDTDRVLREAPLQEGFTLFPRQQPAPILPNGVVLSQEDLAKIKGAPLFNGQIIQPGVIACIGYRPTFNSTSIYHTAYILHLEKSTGSPVAFNIGEDIPAKDLRVMFLPIEGVLAN